MTVYSTLRILADLDEVRALADCILAIEGGRIVGALAADAGDRELGLLTGGGAVPVNGATSAPW